MFLGHVLQNSLVFCIYCILCSLPQVAYVVVIVYIDIVFTASGGVRGGDCV